MSNYTESSRTTSRNGRAYQPVEPNVATLDTFAKIRLDNAAIAAEEKRTGRWMSIDEKKVFLTERDEIEAALNEAKAGMLESRMERMENAVRKLSDVLVKQYGHMPTRMFKDMTFAVNNAVILSENILAKQIALHL